MKFNIDGELKEVYVNGEAQTAPVKKVKLSDSGLKLNEAIKKALAKKKADADS